MEKLDKAYLEVLEFCKHPHRLNDIIYSDLGKRLEAIEISLPNGFLVWWKYLSKIVQDLEKMEYLARNKTGEYYTCVETSKFYKE